MDIFIVFIVCYFSICTEAFETIRSRTRKKERIIQAHEKNWSENFLSALPQSYKIEQNISMDDADVELGDGGMSNSLQVSFCTENSERYFNSAHSNRTQTFLFHFFAFIIRIFVFHPRRSGGHITKWQEQDINGRRFECTKNKTQKKEK